MFFPAHEYFAGIDCPLTNTSLLNSRDMGTSVADGSGVASVGAERSVAVGASTVALGISNVAVDWAGDVVVGDEHATNSVANRTDIDIRS